MFLFRQVHYQAEQAVKLPLALVFSAVGGLREEQEVLEDEVRLSGLYELEGDLVFAVFLEGQAGQGGGHGQCGAG